MNRYLFIIRRKLFHSATGRVEEQRIRKNAIKANYLKLSTSSSLSEYASKFVFVTIMLAILAGGCIEEKEKFEELPKIGPFLEDELNNYKADDNLELIICTFGEITDNQKGILSNFGEIKESVPPISVKGLIESDYWRTTFETKKRYLGNISKIDFVDKIEKLPSKDSEYLDKTESTLVQAALFSPNNKSLGVIIRFKYEIGLYEEDELNDLGVALGYKFTLPQTRTVEYEGTIPVKNVVRILKLDFVDSIKYAEVKDYEPKSFNEP